MKSVKRLRGLNRRMRKANKRGSHAVARSLYSSHRNRFKRRFGW